jgi:uncharacterized delta-60 repeat protein
MKSHTPKQVYLLLMLLVVQFKALNAQVGYADTTFYRGMGANVKCTAGLVLPDSTVIVTGRFSYIHQTLVNGVAKLHADGSFDNSFNVGSGADDYVNVIVRQPDGKLIIAGEFIKYNGVTVNRIARLNTDGSRDVTFTTGAGINGPVYGIYLQPDGKILLGGSFTQFNGTAVKNLVRLNSNGTNDTGFNTGTGCNGIVYAIDQQPDGKILIGGDFLLYNNSACGRIARLYDDGTLDTGFQLGGVGPNSSVTGTAILPNGKIVVGGFFTAYNGNATGRIVCLNADGSEDPAFAVGTGFNNLIQEMIMQPDGKILLCGDFTLFNGTARNRIARINADGTLDNTFDPGTGANQRCNALFLDQSGNVYTGGFFTIFNAYTRLRFARLKPDGSVDQTFFPESKLNSAVLAAGYQSNGQAIVTGTFTVYNGNALGRIARLDVAGNMDNTFNSGTGANAAIRTAVILSTDKILIGGDFTTYNGTTVNRIALLNPDGSLDNTFATGTGFNNTVTSIAVDTTGKIYVAGNFTQFDNAAANRIVRLNATGTRDNGFGGTGFNNVVNKVALQADGKVLCGGNFTSYSSQPKNRIVRLNTNGTLDNTFSIGVGANNSVNTIAIQPDGKIFVGGSFTKYNNITKARIVRLNTNGTLDASLSMSVNNGAVNAIELASNGVLIGGTFTKVNNATRNRIAYVSPAGALNNTFYIGTGASGTVNTFAFDLAERKVLVGGDFENFQSKLLNKLARVEYTNIKLTAANSFPCPGVPVAQNFVKAASFNIANYFSIELSNSNGVFDSNTVVIGTGNANATGAASINMTLPNNIAAGNGYRIRIVSSNPIDTSRISGPVTINIPPSPVIAYSGATDFCTGQKLTLNAPGGMPSYQWSNGATTATTQAGQTGDYSVLVTDNNNCVLKSDTVHITAFPLPDSSVSVSIASLCNGGTLEVAAIPGLSYAWSNGATSSSINVTQTGFYAVTVTDNNGCKSDSSVYANVSSYFNNLIYAEGPTSFCFDTNVTIKAGLGGFNYQWNNQATSQGIVVSTSGTYTVTITDGVCSMAASIPVTVWPEPTRQLTTAGSDTFCAGGILTLQAAPGMQYGWNNGETTQSITISSPGTYYTTLVDQATGCSTTSETLQVVGSACATGIDNLTEAEVSIYPNPTANYLFVNNSSSAIGLCVVVDITGKEMLRFEPTGFSSQAMLDVSNLANGAYVLQTNGKSYRFVRN